MKPNEGNHWKKQVEVICDALKDNNAPPAIQMYYEGMFIALVRLDAALDADWDEREFQEEEE